MLFRAVLPGEEMIAPMLETSFMVISDTHFYDPSLGTTGRAFENYQKYSGKLIWESKELLDAAVQSIIASGVDMLLIPGDLTKDGALNSHLGFAACLDSVEEHGIQVFVVPGNHDVNTGRARSYAGDLTAETAQVGADKFTEIYADFGYEEALYKDSSSLSYIAEPVKDFWLIGLDVCVYPEDPSKGYAPTGGKLRKETLRWLESLLLTEEAAQKTKVLIMHHGILEHFDTQARHFEDYLIHRYKKNSRLLASMGVTTVFTGHFHANDITLQRWKNGTFLFDIETGSLLSYPCPLRQVSIKGDSMMIETQHIQSIPSQKDGLQEYARESIIEGAAHMAERTMIRYKLNREDAGNIAWQMGSLFADHCAGDELAREPPLDLQGVSIWGRLMTFFRRKLASGLVNDLPPADNQLNIHLQTGEYD
jgi:3',5'-cyclic AMP phosphodiesterase CpdA